MECFGGDVNRMVCGDGGVKLVRWWMDWDCDWLGWVWVKSGWVRFRRLCVVCAITGICCKCNSFIQNHAPGLVMANSADNTC